MAKDNLSKLSVDDLTKQRYELVQQLGEYDVEIERRKDKTKVHVKGSSLKWQDHAVVESLTPKSKIQIKTTPIIAPELGFDTSTLMAFMGEIPPKTSGGRYHRHGEAIKYYLSGRAVEIVGDKEYKVEAGDFVFIPPNIWHGTQNPYNEPVRFYAVAQIPGNPLQTPAPYVQK